MLLYPKGKREGVTPHTLHLTRRVQQDNLEGNVFKEMTLQRMLLDKMSQTQTTAVAQPYDKKRKGKATKMKLRRSYSSLETDGPTR